MDRDKVKLPKLGDRAAAVDPERFTEADVADFRAREQAELDRLIRGQPSKEAWTAALEKAIHERIRFKDMVAASIGPHTIAWMLFGLITAFKLTYNKSETEDV